LNPRIRGFAAASGALVAQLMGACSTTAPTIIDAPIHMRPSAPSATVERVATGAIFSAQMSPFALFSSEPPPQRVGDLLKIQIAETQSAENEATATASRESKFNSKGPGSKMSNGLFGSLMNQDATAGGANSVKGDGRSERNRRFTGQMTVSVLNVLPNGFLVVAGERMLSVTGDVSALRFSGVVNPKDIRQGNVVASNDTLNARIEFVGQGELTEAASRSWLQRVFNRALAVW
jgi:flagellar L-ring protein FlgH